MTTTLALSTRPATAADEAFLHDLFVSARGFDAVVLADVPDLMRLQHVARERAHAAAHPSLHDEVVLVDGRPAGRLLTTPVGEGVHVVDLAILPADRGQGLGTLLLERLLAAGPVTLTVALDNPARRLYERLGFAAVTSTATDLSLHHPGHDTFEGAGA